MAKIRGRFYFKLTSNGNLLGEWSNGGEFHSFSESADRTSLFPIDCNQCKFIGEFNSTWHEGGDKAGSRFAKLEIGLKSPNHQNIFRVIWTDTSNPQSMFEGEAMLCDDILIGNYWNKEEGEQT